jgi:hypothetical protein
VYQPGSYKGLGVAAARPWQIGGSATELAELGRSCPRPAMEKQTATEREERERRGRGRDVRLVVTPRGI